MNSVLPAQASQASPAPGSASDPSASGQYLSFLLAGEEYAIDILRVQEIKGLSKVTSIPNAPSHLRGVMNLRGTVVPVVGLRTRFRLADAADGQPSVTVVVNVGARIAGLVVDAVSDVLNFAPAEIEAAPELAGAASFVSGLAKVADRLVMVLDVDRLLGEASAFAA